MGCPEQNNDLAWLLQRNAHRLRNALDVLAVKHGLEGFRDYVLLMILESEQPQTQMELGQRAQVDKTTLMASLDRLEAAGIVERKLNPTNRRVRTPVMTAKGKKVLNAVSAARKASEEIPGMTATELKTLRGLLVKLDAACEAAGMKAPGSCM
ncbi:MAG: MarR family winged helix-turn-helix transcriptional regulator [Archangium sp.]